MARPAAETRIDRLFQLALSDFTSERNALAKDLGADGADVRALQKPTVPAWAVNQLFWRKREVYDDLIERANDLRATHAATLKGKRADLRGASRAHEAAIDAALKATLGLLHEDGHPLTDATKQAISTTLRTLPGDEPPGRLTRQLQPRGFEMFGGAGAPGTVRPAPPAAPARTATTATAKPKSAKATSPRDEAAARAADKRRNEAREALSVATRAVRDAEQAARREEFEAARAARDVDRTERQSAQAGTALEQAQTEFAEAERAAAAAVKARDAALARAARAADHLEDARGKEAKARAALEKLT